MVRVAAYQAGIYPRSEGVVSATRGLERGRTSPAEVADAFRGDLADLVAAQRDAALDLYWDGLLRWQDVFRPLVELSPGMDARSLVRRFDNNAFFRAPEIIGDLTLASELPPVLTDVDDVVPEPRVATLPSPYFFSRAAQTDLDRNALMMDLTREVLAPVARALADRGYGLIHLQEPWVAYFGMDPGDWDDFEKALSELRDAVSGRAETVAHFFYGDVGPFVDRLRKLPVDAVGIDFFETDLDELGTGWETGLFAGVLDGRSSPMESAEGTAGFALRVAEVTQPPTLFLSANSDLEFLPQPIARAKLLRLGEVAAIVKERLS